MNTAESIKSSYTPLAAKPSTVIAIPGVTPTSGAMTDEASPVIQTGFLSAKDRFTPIQTKSDGWRGASWTPDDVSLIWNM